MAKHLNEGFRFMAKICIISNLKKLFLELSKNEELKDTMTEAMMFAPATLLTMNGQVHFEFEDFEEIEDHPLAQAGMMTLGDLINGALGESVEEVEAAIKEIQFDMDKEVEDYQKGEFDTLKAGAEMLMALEGL